MDARLCWWRSAQAPEDNNIYRRGNHTLISVTATPMNASIELPAAQPSPCPWTCELTNDRGYVVYSALGSFYIPMFVMLFFYWRIYRAAVRTTRAINQGFKTTKGKQFLFHMTWDPIFFLFTLYRNTNFSTISKYFITSL